MAVSASLIAGAILDGVTTGNHLRAVIMGIAGLAGFVVAFFLKRKPKPNSPPSLMNNSGNATATATGGAGGAGGNATIGDIIVNVHPAASAAAAPAPAPDTTYSEVLAFLERTKQPDRAVTYFVENIAAATGLAEPEVARVLERLLSEGHVDRREIQGRGSDGQSTKWGYVYWYAHF